MHPMEAKKRLARMIVDEYHGEDAAADRAEQYFESKFQRREVPGHRADLSHRRGSVDLRADEAVTVHALDQRGAPPCESGSSAR